MVLTKEEKKERKRIYDKKYREKNKEKIKDYFKQYHKKNKQYNIERVAKWKLENPEKNKQYLIDNLHIYVISRWKHRGVISDDYKALYDKYMSINNCQVCNKEFNKDILMDRRCLDHNHDTGLFRCVCCHKCNLHNRMIK